MNPQEIYIPVDSQELADELKEICLKYGLPIWGATYAFTLLDKNEVFSFSEENQEYFIYDKTDMLSTKTQINKEQFIELLESIKK